MPTLWMLFNHAISELPDYDLNMGEDSKSANIRRAITLIGKIPTIVVCLGIELGIHKTWLNPWKRVATQRIFFVLLRGEHPTKEEAKIFDISLILHAEHSFNASTFAAREIASTRAHMYASIAGAVGALSGELHGGANVQVMKMLLEIGESGNARDWVRNRLNEGGRIMGMGHAVYRTTDPRAEVLRTLSHIISKERNTKWFEITEQVEKATQEFMVANKGQSILCEC